MRSTRPSLLAYAVLAVVVTVLAVTSGCGTNSDGDEVSTPPSPPVTANVQLPPTRAIADYQLGGAYPPPTGVEVVTRDSTAQPAPGLYNICYINGFQTQPADREHWLSERRDLVLADKSGRPVIDPDWPDELILDTSTEAKRRRLTDILAPTIRQCRDAGFRAVEFDNLDSYSRSRGQLTAEMNFDLAAKLVGVAHEAHLAVGQKNAAELSVRAKTRAGFDFAVTEECFQFRECDSYRKVYGDLVIDIEYPDNLSTPFDRVCTDPSRAATTILRDRKLVPHGNTGYLYQHC
ncbi:endo alpha-1,4 polygalactosaminidase [Nocardia sp. NPDC060256]|uniref:endo alpha-1,4 polygalactosaminidase n=1 Tax=unclassified Nocardia TaxID=2637762 RepID=UPI003652C21A